MSSGLAINASSISGESLMIDTSKLAIIVAAAAFVVASPTFAQSFDPEAGTGNVVSEPVDQQADPVQTGPRAARFSRLYAFVPGRAGRVIVAAPRSAVTVDRNDPALTGGGSLGYNQTVEHGS
jgi:hypothetical protein